LTSSEVIEFPGNQSLVEVGISAAGMHEKGAERIFFQSASRGDLILFIFLYLLSSASHIPFPDFQKSEPHPKIWTAYSSLI
jgi:hypothetical protein